VTDWRAPAALRVLVADDDPDQRFLVRALFARAGIHDVHDVADGDAAVAAVIERAPDLVVLDLAMPARSGLEVLPALHDHAPAAQVVILSNFPRWRLNEVARRRGAVGYVQKRVRPNRLVSEILIAAALAERAAGASRDFPAAVSSPRQARRFVRELLEASDEVLVESVELLVTELVTNAVLHASSAPTVQVHIEDDVVRVEVYDEDPTPLRPGRPSTSRPGGRGLLLLDRMAARWGDDPVGDGKVIWFELDRTAPDA
jgi:CheY-like chemotaxis protein/anti-sigma regulatory factor (Ser/Thr protein kinase)